MTTSQPLVSIVTPLYNEAEYLAECIESVLAQTYQNWDYTIVDNCSTDDSAAIALKYSQKDSRIKLITNERFVTAIENHNIAFRHVSPSSTYWKVLSGDDWLYPEYLAKSVELADRHPRVGVVASYSVNTQFGVRWTRLSPQQSVFDGGDTCRAFLLGRIDSFFAPSVVLYRSSLTKSEDSFFPGSAPSADLSACLNCLAKSDLGVVHQVLSFERIHEDSDTAKIRRMDTYLLDRICILNELAPKYLRDDEYTERLNRLLTEYYETVLVPGIFNFREPEFWHLHRERLRELGYPFYCGRLAAGIVKKSIDLVFDPKQTFEKILRRLKKQSDAGVSGPPNVNSQLQAKAVCTDEALRARH